MHVKVFGEAEDVDQSQINKAKEDMLKWMEFYGADSIFNMDETGLFYKLRPSYTLVER